MFISIIVNIYSYNVNIRSLSSSSTRSFLKRLSPSSTLSTSSTLSPSSTALYGKKDKKKGAPTSGQQRTSDKSERQGQADKFDALTRKYMYTLKDLTKTLPDGSRTILKNINLCFYPGVKIGVVGLNGSGKSSLLRVMAGVDKQFEGTAVPMPGAR